MPKVHVPAVEWTIKQQYLLSFIRKYYIKYKNLPLGCHKIGDPSAGQLERISYLENELGCASPLADSIRYQLLHRTVSDILTARSFHAGITVMLVHSFSPDSRWREDIEAFVAAIGSKHVTGDLYEIELTEGPRLIIGWCKGAEKYLSVELPSGL